MEKNKKVVLAYSGGLDTSVLIKWMVDKGYEVIAFLADLGQGSDFKKIKEKALKCGASKVIIKDLKQEFIKDFIYPSVKAGAVYQEGYYLSTALGRPLIAKELVETALKEKALNIAHGCSGKGNDQVRFELTVKILAPKIKVIAPLRNWEFTSREEEIAYAQKNNIPVEAKKEAPYSLDKNLWGVSIECGQLEDPGVAPPKDAYQITSNPEDAPLKPEIIKLDFNKGILTSLNSKKSSGINLIKKITDLGSKHAIGRSDLIEDRLVGIKSREIYEAPAACIIHCAHRALESMVLDKDVLKFKKIISLKYAEIIYNGLWYSKLKESMDAFIEETQENVTGSVEVKLYKGSCFAVKRNSKYSLYNKKLATYEQGDKFDHKASEGFIKIFGLSYCGRKGKFR